MELNRRKHPRISATAFLNMPIRLNPLPPFFGKPLTGRLIDLSAGGLSLLIEELIPQGSVLEATIRFPDQTEFKVIVEVRHAFPKDRKFLHGFEFLTLPAYWSAKIEKMSNDYIDCETRIQSNTSEICHLDCAFYTLCTKAQRREPVFNADIALEMAMETLKNSPLYPK